MGFTSRLGHLEREKPQLGDLRSALLLTTYKSWDDPPSATLTPPELFACGHLKMAHISTLK